MAGSFALASMLGSAVQGKIAGLGQTLFGLTDTMRGNKMLKKAESFYEKNKYKIPESSKASLGVAERMALGVRLPGEDIYRDRLGQTTATGLTAARQAATSSSDILELLSGFMGQQNQGEQDLALAGVNRYDRNQLQLQNSLNMMANREKEFWDYNVLYKYQQMLGRAQTLSDRGRQGISMGLNSLGQTNAGFMQAAGAENQYDTWHSNLMGSVPGGGGSQGGFGSYTAPGYRGVNLQTRGFGQ